MQRLDKLIAAQGALSRRDVKALAADGRISVNGETLLRADMKIDEQTAEVRIDGQALCVRKHLYLMLNKPEGYVSSTATEDSDFPSVLELVPEGLRRRGLFPAGRLDKDTTGLVIITDDGALAHRMLSPAKHVPKKYLVTLDLTPTAEMVRKFADGILLNDGKCKPAILDIIAECTAEVTISEGRYHQIKRMFAVCGAAVTALRRIAIGGVKLPPELPEGVCAELTPQQVADLEKRY